MHTLKTLLSLYTVYGIFLSGCVESKHSDTENNTADTESDTNEDNQTEPSNDTEEPDVVDEPEPNYECGNEGLYTPSPIGQWKVCLSNTLIQNSPTIQDQTLALLNTDLDRIETLLDNRIVSHLQTVFIWVEEDVEQFPGAVYHPSPQWLSQNGYPTYWAESIQIGNAANYLSWTSVQPAMVLHELSHAWHHQVLGYDQTAIKAAYDNAMATGIYSSVPYAGGGNQTAYATNNEMEYFAELTEAYFWENDFYPFVQSELQEFDPMGYQAVEEAWQYTE